MALAFSDITSFLESVHLLRKQKGKYLCENFCVQLEWTSRKIEQFVFNHSSYQRSKTINKKQHEKISENLIDLCLECAEIELKKIHDFTVFIDENKVLFVLRNIAEALSNLASHIRFTLTSVSSRDVSVTKNSEDEFHT